MLTIIINGETVYQGTFNRLIVINEEQGPIEIQKNHTNCMFTIKDQITIFNPTERIIDMDNAIIKVEQNNVNIVGKLIKK